MQEVAGDWGRYRLEPITGQAAPVACTRWRRLDLPLRNDPFYPVVNDPPEGDYSRPLQLLADAAWFDPLTGQERATLKSDCAVARD